ncbi:MAG: glycosyltransferase family 39 protein [Barnesiella sp.]|nr:glycosyltransferase family 39 protein [Bacteroidales bacterium]MBD5246585.1 glycosyltransferase family 39 protein [Barnesiella sp.]
MKYKSLTVKQQNWLLIIVLLCISIYYLLQLTHSGLWYDEGIEYLYSKYLSGPLPNNVVANARDTFSMYDRIVSTYQPPLYNVVMYVWLSVFDSEFMFRFAGLIFTIAGGFGLYKTLKYISGNFYCALTGMTLYLTIPCIAYYTVECGEYNLMLCLLQWAIYYFCRCFIASDDKTNRNSLIKFLVFGCLAAYTQYGAILAIGMLFILITMRYIRNKNKSMIKLSILGGLIVITVFGLPLLFFFLLPQMQMQESITVSHSPVFINNILYSLWYGIVKMFRFFILSVSSRLFDCILAAFSIMAFAALFYKNRTIFKLWLATITNYLLYFILVACSFYAYNRWDGNLGCYNLGQRYILYLIPIAFLTFYYSIYVFYKNFILNGKYKNLKIILFYGLIAVYIAILVKIPGIKEKSSGERDAFSAWYNAQGYDYCTVVENFQNPAFQFYYMHCDKYDPQKESIVGECSWSRQADSNLIYNNFEKMGVFSNDTVFYVSSSLFGKNEKLKNHDIAMRRAGYKPEFILDSREDANNLTSVIKYTRQRQY